MNLPTANFSLLYNGKDITADISNQVISVEYSDKLTGQSDELEIKLEDTDGRWQNGWYPEKGATLQMFIRQGSQQLNCGTFEIDEPEISISTGGDIFSIKGLGAGFKQPMRTKNSYAHEDKSLSDIAKTVAANLGLTLLGTPPEITIHRLNQYRETNLAFLNRIGEEYGCIFSVRGTNLVFVYYQDIETKAASLTLVKNQIISATIKDATHKTFKNCRVRHHDPKTNSLVSYDVDEEESDDDEETGSDDALELHARVENKQQAGQKAKYALFKNNTQGVGGDFTTVGNILLVSGNNVTLSGIGNFSGTFHILEAKHTLSRGGAYTTSCNIKRITK